MTYLEFGKKKTEMDETENTVAEILDDLINSALDKIFQGRNFYVFGLKMNILKLKMISDSNPEVKARVEKIKSWRKDQIDSMNEILSQIDSHYETLNELLSKRQEGLANEVCEHFEKRLFLKIFRVQKIK